MQSVGERKIDDDVRGAGTRRFEHDPARIFARQGACVDAQVWAVWANKGRFKRKAFISEQVMDEAFANTP
jgi:hypothetical protein